MIAYLSLQMEIKKGDIFSSKHIKTEKKPLQDKPCNGFFHIFISNNTP